MKKFKVLHVGNIANNAYLNSKFLREKGIQADVLCYDYYHIMATPEWEDAEIIGDWGDDYNPNWSKCKLGTFARPEWFFQGELNDIGKKTFKWQNNDYLLNRLDTSLLVNRFNGFVRTRFWATIIAILNFYTWSSSLCKIKPIEETLEFLTDISISYLDWARRQLLPPAIRCRQEKFNSLYYKSLIKDFRLYFPERKDKLSMKDILIFLGRIDLLKHIFKNYDIIQAYASDPIFALLTNKHPYVAFEHGTLRDLPFEDSSLGRLTALAYRKADLVFITNPDNINAAKRLGLNNSTYIPHPIDESKTNEKNRKQNLKKKLGVDYLFFAPARQNWEIKGNDIVISGYNLFVKQNPSLKSQLILADWGDDTKKTKRLIKSLKMENKIIWVKALFRKKLRHYFQESDVILDQFKGYFGAIAPEAMLFKKPVVTWFDKQLYDWAFKKMPPVILAKNSQEIANSLEKLVKNNKYYRSVSLDCHKWYKEYHSQRVVTEKLLKAYKEFL